MSIVSTTRIFSSVLIAYTIACCVRTANGNIKVSAEQFDEWNASFLCTRADFVHIRVCSHLDSAFKTFGCKIEDVYLFDTNLENAVFMKKLILECELSDGKLRYVTQGSATDYEDLVLWYHIGGFVYPKEHFRYWAYFNYVLHGGQPIDPLADVTN